MIRLHGIDAPERAQQCRSGADRDWACGMAAERRLRELVARRTVTCSAVADVPPKDSYGRRLAVCGTPEIPDVGAVLVHEGLALAFRRYSRRYLGEEAHARQRSLGMWTSVFEPPWEWRQRRRGR